MTANKTVLSSLWKAAEKTESKGRRFILKRKRPKYKKRRECSAFFNVRQRPCLQTLLHLCPFSKHHVRNLMYKHYVQAISKSNSECPTTLEGCLVCSTITTESCEIWKQVTENILLFISPKLRMSTLSTNNSYCTPTQ